MNRGVGCKVLMEVKKRRDAQKTVLPVYLLCE